MPDDHGLDDLELYLLQVMEGRRRGLIADLLRAAATALSWIYAGCTRLHRALYERRIFKSRRGPLPVISVGNLTVGGTGKTPFVGYLARGLTRQKHRPAILARGYRARTRGGSNDELEMLADQLPDVLTVANPNRLAACMRAAEEGADVAVLDDGFQHYALQRDLDVLLIDATHPFGTGRLLPRGTLREPAENAARADLVVLTRVALAGLSQVGELRTWLRRLQPEMPVVECCFRPKALRPLGDAAEETLPPEALSGRKIGAFAGLAQPRGFGQTLRSVGAEVVYSRRFPDHHRYSARDIAAVVEGAASAGAEMLVTTEKDAVKLEELPAPDSGMPLHCLCIETEIDAGEDLLWLTVGKAIADFKRD